MYKCINGVCIEMTPEELAEHEKNISSPEPTAEERISELEEALALLLSGVTE